MYYIKKEHLYDQKNLKGFIENFIRNQRSSNPAFKAVKGVFGKRKVNDDHVFIVGNLIDEELESNNIEFLRKKVVRSENDRDSVSTR